MEAKKDSMSKDYFRNYRNYLSEKLFIFRPLTRNAKICERNIDRFSCGNYVVLVLRASNILIGCIFGNDGCFLMR